MKSFFVLASLAACAFAQRLSILEPTAEESITGGSPFTVELQQAGSLGPVQQVSVVIAVTSCYDVCSDPTQWGLGTVLYNGPFNPQYNSSAPQKGLFQDFTLTMPDFVNGGVALQVSHLLNVGGATLSPAFDYSYVLVDVD
ncbi:hypothetical protein EW026_g5202 [Hermanssonia centrifuga]|uniref:Uncharacterized protein n=1 Tax=Hermanssonia centrifuga TaxID=98765 RepID=A0A4S4KF28_9APHY|nr:hypothetical protein EW026_g5202 [Hermanssonia centrifuga]